MYTAFASSTHDPSSAHAPESHSESSVHARHTFPSQTGLVALQSIRPAHSTHAPLVGSQKGAREARALGRVRAADAHVARDLADRGRRGTSGTRARRDATGVLNAGEAVSARPAVLADAVSRTVLGRGTAEGGVLACTARPEREQTGGSEDHGGDSSHGAAFEGNGPRLRGIVPPPNRHAIATPIYLLLRASGKSFLGFGPGAWCSRPIDGPRATSWSAQRAGGARACRAATARPRRGSATGTAGSRTDRRTARSRSRPGSRRPGPRGRCRAAPHP
jgi:hypothetical protein